MFRDKVEVPGNRSVHLVLPRAAAVNNGSAWLALSVTIEPLLSQHDDERDGEGSGQAGVEDGLGVTTAGPGPVR